MIGPKKPHALKGVDVKICLGEDSKPEIGKVAPIDLEVSTQEPYFMDHVLFELINMRTDKRAPLDRVTSQSRYLYRFNKKAHLSPDSPQRFTYELRFPMHKEPTKNDKFISIKWYLSARIALYHSEDENDKNKAEFADSENVELQVV